MGICGKGEDPYNQDFQQKMLVPMKASRMSIDRKHGLVQQGVKELKKNYRIEKDTPVLGTGAFGKVFLSHNLHVEDLKVAIKVMKKSQMQDDEIEGIINEVNIIGQLDHPHIVKYYETYQSKDYIYMVMEYVEGMMLFDKITSAQNKHFGEKQACHYMEQIFYALNHCHAQGVIHRDLKPENIMVTQQNDSCKLIDFGLLYMRFLGHLYFVQIFVFKNSIDQQIINIFILTMELYPSSDEEDRPKQDKTNGPSDYEKGQSKKNSAFQKALQQTNISNEEGSFNFSNSNNETAIYQSEYVARQHQLSGAITSEQNPRFTEVMGIEIQQERGLVGATPNWSENLIMEENKALQQAFQQNNQRQVQNYRTTTNPRRNHGPIGQTPTWSDHLAMEDDKALDKAITRSNQRVGQNQRAATNPHRLSKKEVEYLRSFANDRRVSPQNNKHPRVNQNQQIIGSSSPVNRRNVSGGLRNVSENDQLSDSDSSDGDINDFDKRMSQYSNSKRYTNMKMQRANTTRPPAQQRTFTTRTPMSRPLIQAQLEEHKNNQQLRMSEMQGSSDAQSRKIRTISRRITRDDVLKAMSPQQQEEEKSEQHALSDHRQSILSPQGEIEEEEKLDFLPTSALTDEQIQQQLQDDLFTKLITEGGDETTGPRGVRGFSIAFDNPNDNRGSRVLPANQLVDDVNETMSQDPEQSEAFKEYIEGIISAMTTGNEEKDMEAVAMFADQIAIKDTLSVEQAREELMKIRQTYLDNIQAGADPEKEKAAMSYRIYFGATSFMKLGGVSMRGVKTGVVMSTQGVGQGIWMAGGCIISPVAISFVSILFLCEAGINYRRMKNGKINRREFRRRLRNNGVATVGGLAGASAGSTIGFLVGSATFPVVGSILGVIIGGAIGAGIAKKICEKSLGAIDKKIAAAQERARLKAEKLEELKEEESDDEESNNDLLEGDDNSDNDSGPGNGGSGGGQGLGFNLPYLDLLDENYFR